MKILELQNNIYKKENALCLWGLNNKKQKFSFGLIYLYSAFNNDRADQSAARTSWVKLTIKQVRE